MLQCHQLPSGRAACDSRLESPLPAVKSHPPQPSSLGSSGGPDPLGLLTPLSWLVFSLPGPHHSQASSSEKGVCPDGQLLASPSSSRVTFLVPRATKHTRGPEKVSRQNRDRSQTVALPFSHKRWLRAGHCPGSQKERRCCPWLIPSAQVLSTAQGRGRGVGQHGHRRGAAKNYLLFPPRAPGTIPL